MNEKDKRRAFVGIVKNIGIPAKELLEAIERLFSMQEYKKIRFDAVYFYCQKLIFGDNGLISSIYSFSTPTQLEELNTVDVKLAFIMLLRDMMQNHRNEIVIDAKEQRWDLQRIEQFTVGLLYEMRVPIEPYLLWFEIAHPNKEELLDMTSNQEEEPLDMLIALLAKQLSLEPDILYVWHKIVSNTTLKDVLSHSQIEIWK